MECSHSKSGAGAVRWAIYVLCLFPAISGAQRVDTLIQSLADPDSAKRANAERELATLGVEARPALIAASRANDPAISPVAARILMAIPWYRVSDPPPVQMLLRGYGELTEPGRIATIGQLARLGSNVGLPAMLRLILEDPSEDVCWNVVSTQTLTAPDRTPLIQTPVVLAQLKHLNPPDDRPAALVLASYTWLATDRPKALQFARRAVDAETRRPSYDGGELDFAFDLLVDAALVDKRYDDAADLRRLHATRIGVTRDRYPSPIYDLFIIHARYGPLKSLDSDVQSYAAYLGHPMVIYALGESYRKAGRTLESLACRQAAAACLTEETRWDFGRNLNQSGWVDQARREFYAIAGTSEVALSRHKFDAVAALSLLATRDDADAAAIGHFNVLRDLLPTISWLDGVDRRAETASAYSAEILWRQARIALDAGKKDEANARLTAMLELTPSDTDVVQNSYPMLVALNRKEDALKLFQAGYDRLSQSMAKEPDSPRWWNDLAWISSRCDQRLDEALEHAKKAVAADPDNASYIDTLAEVYFRHGQAAEALKLETRALQIEPGDIFMTKQIERFRGLNKVP